MSEHAPASQHAPEVHALRPVQRMSQLRPSQRTFPMHALVPEQVTALASARTVTPAPHADVPEQVTVQSSLRHVTAPRQELSPQTTEHVEPPQETAPQPEVAVQSTVQALAAVQSTLARAPSAGVAEHGTPGGHTHDAEVHGMTHVPPLQVPASQTERQLASVTGAGASAEPSAGASVAPSGPPPCTGPSRLPASCAPPASARPDASRFGPPLEPPPPDELWVASSDASSSPTGASPAALSPHAAASAATPSATAALPREVHEGTRNPIFVQDTPCRARSQRKPPHASTRTLIGP